MPRYRLLWEIDIEAGTPEQAARQALAIQRDPQSTATAFTVRMVGPCPSCHAMAVHKAKCNTLAKLFGSGTDNELELAPSIPVEVADAKA
jgi:hypothetical protein